MKKVFLDANVLYSGTNRSLFIWLHTNKVVEIYWSQPAWDEVFKNYGINNPEKDMSFRSSMKKNAIDKFNECMVSLATHAPMGLKDKDDEHILAAAVQSNCEYLLTNDLILLSEALQAALTITLMSPDDFLSEVAVKYASESVRQSVEDHINSLNSKPSKADYLSSLNKSQLTKFAAWL